mgnify:CR=1 FL=1
MLVQPLVFTLPQTSVTVLLSKFARIGVLDEADLSLGVLAANLLFAALEALEDGPPLEVEQCHDHSEKPKQMVMYKDQSMLSSASLSITIRSYEILKLEVHGVSRPALSMQRVITQTSLVLLKLSLAP